MYRWTRNPMYLGMALALLGGFCAYLTRFQIIPEERALRRVFGESYAACSRRVRCWI